MDRISKWFAEDMVRAHYTLIMLESTWLLGLLFYACLLWTVI